MCCVVPETVVRVVSRYSVKMALLPLLLNELEELRRPRLGDLFDQHFGMGLLNDQLVCPRQTILTVPLRSGYTRPWRTQASEQSGVSNITADKNMFKVNLDVQQFKPEEISVKVVDDFLVIDARHEERQDSHGYISRHFTRRYKVPSDVDIDAVKSKLSSDGVLTLEAPKKVVQGTGERSIPIVHTNAPAVKTSETKEGKEKQGQEKTEEQ